MSDIAGLVSELAQVLGAAGVLAGDDIDPAYDIDESLKVRPVRARWSSSPS